MLIQAEGGPGGLREAIVLAAAEARSFVRWRLAMTLGTVVCASVLTAFGPVALKVVVDQLTGAIGGKPSVAVLWIVVYVGSQYLARCLTQLRGIIYARGERRLLRQLGEHVFKHIMRVSFRVHQERATGNVTQSIANGLLGYQILLNTFIFSIVPVLTEVGSITFALGKMAQPAFLALFSGAMVGYSVVFVYAARKTRTAAGSASAAQVEAVGVMSDAVLNYEGVKYFGGEALAAKKVSGALVFSEIKWVKFYRQFGVNGLLVVTIYAAFLFAAIWHASKEALAGRISIGTFLLINTYMWQVVRPVEVLGNAVQSLAQGIAYLEKMLDLLRQPTEAEVALPSSADNLPPVAETVSLEQAEDASNASTMVPTQLLARRCVPVAGSSPELEDVSPATWSQGFEHREPTELEFRNVSVSYKLGQAVLKGVSFRLPAGTTMAVVGASGSGKSTIVRLLARLLEPDDGTILLNDTPIQRVPLTQLRQWVAVVPQETFLFNDSIAYNIAFGRPGCTQSEIEQAAMLAHLHDSILARPDGYLTRIGERGVQLSGGERQRISIARAVLRRPRIYVADEGTSSLDSQTEAEIVRHFREVSRNTTTLIIAHRLSTVVHADEILVLHGGRVAEQGSHEWLLRQNGRYAALWRAQHRGSAAA